MLYAFGDILLVQRYAVCFVTGLQKDGSFFSDFSKEESTQNGMKRLLLMYCATIKGMNFDIFVVVRSGIRSLEIFNPKYIIMKFSYYGQSCFGIETGHKHFLFDPYISPNPLAKDVDVDQISADYILISHGHNDHFADVMDIAKRTGALVICAYEIAEWISSKGYENVHGINHGSKEFDFGKLHFVPAIHSSSLPDGTYGGNAGGFILNLPEKKFYYAGDTCLTMEMKLVPEYCHLDFALLPIGGNFTMDVDDALKAASFIQCDKIIGIHFDTFDVIKIDREAAVGKFSDAGKTLILPAIGETLELDAVMNK